MSDTNKEKKSFDYYLTRIFYKLYQKSGTTAVTILWIIASFHLTFLYKYENCIKQSDTANTFFYIVLGSVLVILVIYTPIILYFFRNRKKIGIEKLNIVERNERGFGFGNAYPQVYIIPMYIFFVFSLSKIIVILVNSFGNTFSQNLILEIAMLSAICFFSLLVWFYFKKTSDKSWSLQATIFASVYISINIFWEYFLPFLQSYVKTWNCIFQTLLA